MCWLSRTRNGVQINLLNLLRFSFWHGTILAHTDLSWRCHIGWSDGQEPLFLRGRGEHISRREAAARQLGRYWCWRAHSSLKPCSCRSLLWILLVRGSALWFMCGSNAAYLGTLQLGLGCMGVWGAVCGEVAAMSLRLCVRDMMSKRSVKIANCTQREKYLMLKREKIVPRIK